MLKISTFGTTASALSCCSWPLLAPVFLMTCVSRFQELMRCIRPVGRGSIKSRWFADRSFLPQVCMTCKYTVYEITPFSSHHSDLLWFSYPLSFCKALRPPSRAGLLSGSVFDSCRTSVPTDERSTEATLPLKTNFGNVHSGMAKL